MANLNATANVNEVSFCFSISNISKLDGNVLSPEYLIDGARWKVVAQKRVSDANSSLALYLYCIRPESTTNWSHVMSVTSELLSFKSGSAAKKGETGPIVYDHSRKNFGFPEFIQWHELFNAKHGYVKDDTINLQIKIRAESRKAKVTKFDTINKSCDDGCFFTFRTTVSDIESLSAAKTPKFILRKMPCQFLLSKHLNKLGIYLLVNSTQLVRQAMKFEIEVKLVSSNDVSNRCKKFIMIGPVSSTLRITKLISWDELLDPNNGFIKDGSITIEFEIKTELLDSVPNANKRKTVNDQQLADKLPKLECKICKKAFIDQDISSLPCGHMFCSPCITESIKVQKVCPSCDVRATQNGLRCILLPKSD